MKKKLFPFPALLFLALFFIFFLLGSDSNLPVMLIMLALFLVSWYFLGPNLKEPSAESSAKKGQEPSSYVGDMFLWMWTSRLYEDSAFRKKLLAAVLLILLVGTPVFAWFNPSVIRLRAALLMGLCALGLLWLLVDAIRRRKQVKTDEASYPTPEVNMNFDHDALAESRVRALRQRLERLEDWRRSGQIDENEYEELRKKYLSYEENS